MRKLAVIVVAVLLSGCSVTKVREAADRAQRTNMMKMVGLAFLEFSDANGNQAPTKIDDLKRYLDKDEKVGKYLSDDITVIWGVSLKQIRAAGDPGTTVIAHEKDAATKGGLCLFADGTVQNLTAEEFGKATLAKKK